MQAMVHGYPPDGALAAGNSIFRLSRMATDAAGSLYFNDESADVRKITPTESSM
jgi:hypothetical protein